jgi:hypothetical protein
VELKTPVKINLLGHEATISYISARLRDGIWYKEDLISVQFDFAEAIDGTLSFGIYLPVSICQDCDREGFLFRAKREGEKRLAEIIEKDKVEKEKRKQEEERGKELDTTVQNIVNRLSSE